jgi:transcriptional regulator with XRE-family HTH domain
VSGEHTLVVSESTGVGERVRLARIAAGLSPEDLARSLEISRRTYERTEEGRRKPSRGELVIIAHRTGQDLSFFGASLEDGPGTLPHPLPAGQAEDAA